MVPNYGSLSLHISTATIVMMSAAQDQKKNGPHEFATFLENIFASEIGFELPRLKTLVREVH